MPLTPNQRARLQVHSGCSQVTIKKHEVDPSSVTEASRLRIEKAAREEGIELAVVPAVTPTT